MDKIKEKIDHNEGVTPNAGAAAPREDVIDLVSALQASIERTKGPDREAAKAPAAKGTAEKKKKRRAKSFRGKIKMGITMQPVLTTSAPSGGNWRYEVKYDGYRGLLKIAATGEVSLISRNSQPLENTFPEISEFAKA